MELTQRKKIKDFTWKSRGVVITFMNTCKVLHICVSALGIYLQRNLA